MFFLTRIGPADLIMVDHRWFKVGSLGGIVGPATQAPDADGLLMCRFDQGYAFGESASNIRR